MESYNYLRNYKVNFSSVQVKLAEPHKFLILVYCLRLKYLIYVHFKPPVLYAHPRYFSHYIYNWCIVQNIG